MSINGSMGFKVSSKKNAVGVINYATQKVNENVKQQRS
jgi:hypothetical protein